MVGRERAADQNAKELLAEAADRMGITKSGVSQIERGEISTVRVISRYVQAIGGQLQISAVFGNDLLSLHSAVTSAA